jgi:KDO2-lipid IV(A) lauroyltransferase
MPVREPPSVDAAADRSSKPKSAPEPPLTPSRCLAPRFWSTWAVIAWLRMTACLPLPAALKVHKLLGRRLLWSLLPRRRAIVQRNLEICFPELGPEGVERLAREHFANIGAFFAELAFAWFASSRRLARLFHIEGIEHLRAALDRGSGVVLVSGHFTPLEICTPAIKPLVPLFAFMYTPRRNALLDAFQSRGRERTGHESFPNSDLRALLRALKRNAVVWYAPDQAYAGSTGELLTFFGEPAMTNTGASRIARLTGAAIVPLFYCRRPDDSGYLLRFHAPLPGVPSDDPVRDTRALTAQLEEFVRECPAQYFWTHRKFKGRPPPYRDPY